MIIRNSSSAAPSQKQIWHDIITFRRNSFPRNLFTDTIQTLMLSPVLDMRTAHQALDSKSAALLKGAALACWHEGAD